ncbi:MAG: hypothetical protein JO019_04005 [Candidatus Kaiserbacteria bacterium]|nr:hypothetical protein [Candidatus Kaiserbacteria bacterium]
MADFELMFAPRFSQGEDVCISEAARTRYAGRAFVRDPEGKLVDIVTRNLKIGGELGSSYTVGVVIGGTSIVVDGGDLDRVGSALTADASRVRYVVAAA